MAYATNLEDWNPMAASYHDANINSYETGPGVHLMPYNRSAAPNPEYRLHVTQIPLELSEEGVQQVFHRYGKTLKVFSPPGAGWAFVTYSSFREAESAIRELNLKPPLNLNVKFARKKETDTKKLNPMKQHSHINNEPIPPPDNQRRQYISPEHHPMHIRSPTCNLGRGRELAALASRGLNISPKPLYHENDDLLYPAVHDPHLYNPYEDAEPFAGTNRMWARGRLPISSDGTRFVSMGRGNTYYELPNPHPRVRQQIRAVYERREAGLYEYGVNKSTTQIGKCQQCLQTATMRCERCKEFYCSRACQEIDWPRHKIECQAIPALEGAVDSCSLSISSGDDTPRKRPVKRGVQRLRRPLTVAAPLPNSTSTPVPAISPLTGIAAAIPGDVLDQRENESPNISIPKRDSGNEKQVNDHNDRAKNSAGWKPMQTQGSFDKKLLTPKPVKAGESQQVDHMNRNFFKRGSSSQQQLQKNCNQEDLDERVKNMKINKNENEKTAAEKPSLPEPDVSFHKATDVPKISTAKLPNKEISHSVRDNAVAGTSGRQFVSKPVINDVDKKPTVQIDKMKATSFQATPASGGELRNIIELLEVNEEGCFEAHVLLGSNKAAVTVCVLQCQEEYVKLSSELTPHCEETRKPSSFKPKIGDMVCGKRLDDWIRGRVASLGPPMRLEAVDEGRIEPVTDFKPIPQEFSKLPTLGAICELTKAEFKLEPMAPYTFMVLNKDSKNVAKDGVEVVLFSADEKEGRGFLKPWVPAPEQRGLPYANLKSGTEVCIASYRSHALIFARSLVPEQLEMFNRMTQDVAHWSTKAERLSEMPMIGELIIAKYVEDGNFYRAIVRKINDEKIIVSYVDYGNIETTVIENLRTISPKLKEYPSCAAKIVLKDVPKDIAMTKDVHEYLGVLAGTEKALMCNFEGSPSTDGVILKTADGTCVNKKIIELLTPSWKKEEDKTSVFMVGDLDVAELGAVGSTSNVLNLFSYGPLMHAMAPQDLELIEHVTGVMAAQMEEYCKQLKENYIPRQSELCLAPYEGLWYRAVCLEPNTTNTTSTVNFIDFGNIEEIPHKDLRLMSKDFMAAKTLASVCQVVGLGPVDADGELPPAIAARVTELLPSNAVTLVKIVECTKPGEYVVELPEVREILVKEGLLIL